MIKKYFAGAFVLLLTASILSSYGASTGKDVGEAAELVDVFAGPVKINCRTETDKIILLPGNENEAVFERRTD